MTQAGIYLAGIGLGGLNGLAAALLSLDEPAKQWNTQTGTRRLKWGAALGLLIGLYDVWLFESLNTDFWGLLLLAGCLLSASMSDLANREIKPCGMGVYAVLLCGFQLSQYGLSGLLNGLLGAGIGACVFGLPHLLRPAEIGRGDVLLLAICGLGAGAPGVIYVLFRGLAALALVSLVQLARKKVQIKSEMPFAPFLLLGALI